MSIKSNIKDTATGLEANVVNGDEKNALVVATRPLKTFDNKLGYFRNSTYGVDMNVNGAFGGDPEHIYDGTDNVLADSGTTDGSTTTDKLIQSGQNFSTTVAVDMTVHNTTDDTYALVTAVDSDTQLSLDTDIMATGETYTIGDYWTASDIVGGGKTDFVNTGQNHTTGGTKSIRSDNSPVGDVYQLLKATDKDLTGNAAFTMWIYVDKDWKLGDAVDFYGWDTTAGAQVGTKVDLSDYFDYLDYDAWHKITILLADMGLTGETIDAVRMEQEAAEGKAPKYYLDDLQIEETGTPITFTLEAELGTWLHVKSLQLVVADDFVSTVVAGTLPGIPYDNLLGATITNGIGYKRISDGETVNAATISKFVDLMTLSNATITGSGGDLTNSWLSVNIQFSEDVILKAENEDKMTLSINDDLSGLLYLRVGVGSKVESRE